MMTIHSLERAKERLGKNEKNAKKQIKKALERGKGIDWFTTSMERDFLERKIEERNYCS